MSFSIALESFISKLNDSLESPLDEQFLNLIRDKATEVFEPYCQKLSTPMTAAAATVPVAVAAVTKVKKPPNAYNCFVKDYSSKHPNTAGIMKVVGPIWAGMDAAARAPFVEQSNALKAAAAVTAAAVAMAAPAAVVATGGAAPGVAPAPAKKKRGKTGYNLYVAEHRNGDNTMKQVGEMWHALTEAERTAYNNQAKGITEATPK